MGSFFFQAEDGIRDVLGSRGLGDVYKRQDIEKANKQLNEILKDLSLSLIHI